MIRWMAMALVSAVSAASAAFVGSAPARDVQTAAETATASRLLASRSVHERKWEEERDMYVKPVDEAVARAFGRVRSFIRGQAGTR